MSAQPAPEVPTSIDQAVEAIWKKVLAGEYPNAGHAARALWLSFSFSDDVLDWLALEGLVEYARAQQRSLASNSTESRPAIAWGSPHGKKFDRYVALTWPLPDANRQQKSLLYWTTADWSALDDKSTGEIVIWASRKKLAKYALELLAKHKVDQAKDLPSEALAALNENVHLALKGVKA